MQIAAEFNPVPSLSTELGLDPRRISAVLALLTEGNTVPFIARYRKEVTGELDEVQIRTISERHAYLTELHERKLVILASIEGQGKLTDELRAQIVGAETKAALEDLYLPYKPKRRTRATIARERGLEPLTERLLAQPDEGDPAAEAAGFLNAEVGDSDAALAGARDIAAEVLSERADVRALVRETFFRQGVFVSEVVPEKRDQATKFQQYYDYREAVANIPSHRFLAIRRGEREDVLRARIEVDAVALTGHILAAIGHRPQSPFGPELRLAAEDAYTRLIAPSVENDVRVELKERSDTAAVDVFASNLRNLLMASPLGDKAVLGVDPGLRTGCKVATLDGTGKYLEFSTLFLSASDEARDKAARTLRELVARHRPSAIAVGNGTGSREAEAFVRRELQDAFGKEAPVVVQVSEAGASVYSASDVAREEFPDEDVTVRGAISIGRRLQDPLAELVKIDPKAIGVGQYQHDVHQPLLARKLDEVVESCVNQVGVELNTASAPLLSRVAGIGSKAAMRIVAHRNQHGPFHSRRALLEVSGIGPRTFEQAAGFLRVRGSEHPLDASAVHPERYDLVERIACDLGVPLPELVGNTALAARIDPHRYVSDDVGEPTLRDIVQELQKPGRDPRSTFIPVQFREDVNTIGDLQTGMALEGVVTNVTDFGAFVDIGVHRDGLVHISQLADEFVRDPHRVVKVGDRLRVRVLEVDVARERISLTARSDAPAPDGPPSNGQRQGGQRQGGQRQGGQRQGGQRQGGQRQGGQRQGGQRQGGQRQEKDPSESLTHNPFAKLFSKH